MNNPAKNNLSEPSKCPKCGTEFYCSTSSKCWCYEVDVSSETMEQIQKNFEGCLCPKCFEEYSS